jgi:hypothetical protein
MLVIESNPVARKTGTMNAEAVARSEALARQWVKAIYWSRQTVQITANEQDLNRVLHLVERAFPQFAGQVDIQENKLSLLASYHLPDNPVGSFVNLRIVLPSSPSGVAISRMSLGDLPIDGDLALAVSRWALDLVFGHDQGTSLVSAIRSVIIAGDRIYVAVRPPLNLKLRLKTAVQRLKELRDDYQPLGDPEVIAKYYRRMLETGSRLPTRTASSFSPYLKDLFELAYQRSSPSTAAEENAQAILALTMFLGDPRTEMLIGSVRPDSESSPGTAPKLVHLAGRRDLMLHFIVSAGLEVLANSGVSFTAGEFKELLDSAGRSGFSFADLAADRAGLRFAALATEPATARHVQQILRQIVDETAYFPSIEGLPEGLSQQEFEEIYKDVDSAMYRSLLDEIDRRIEALFLSGIKCNTLRC